MQSLEQLRESIDRVDDKLLELLEQRMEFVHHIGVIKQQQNSHIYRPDRERNIIDRLFQQANRLTKEAIEAIFLEIFSTARSLERTEQIAYLGPANSFTHQAAQAKLGMMSEYIDAKTIESVFKMVINRQCKYGVIPIENSSNGIVNDTIEGFRKYQGVHIIAEYMMDIHHTLATHCADVKNIRTIYSKDIALRQCREFLYAQNLGDDRIEWVEVSSTTQAAKLSNEQKNSAAICSRAGAKAYQLPILFDSIEDEPHNRTRFFIISDRS